MKIKTVLLCVIALTGFSGVVSAQSKTEIESMKKQLTEVMQQREVEKANLKNFDDLDFNVYG